MAKKSTVANMASTLLIVCFSASAILSGAYALTKVPIDTAQALIKNEAISAIVPTFDNTPSKDKFSVDYKGKTYSVYPAKEKGEIVGYAIESIAGGYGGPVLLIIGFTADGTISGTSILAHTETPGLGDKIEASKSDFSLQFIGKNPANFKLSVKNDGGDVDAITGSTVTSKAFCEAVANAGKVFELCKNR